MNKLLKIAMESDEVAAVAGVDADESKTVKVEPGEDAIIITGKDIAIIDAEGDAVADSVEAAEDAAEEADELDEDIDEAEGAVEALEAMAIVLESSIEKGQMDATGVKLLKIATESIFSRLDMPESHCVLAMESIRERAGVVTGTAGAQIALEDLKDRIKQIWEAIKAGMMKVMQYLREFSKKVMDALPSMENRAKKLLEVSRGLSGAPKTTEVGSNALAKSLAIGNTVPRALGSELSKAVAFARTAAGPKVAADLGGAAKELGDNISWAKSFIPVVQAVMSAGLSKSSNNEAAGVPAAPEGCEAYASDVLLGNAVVWSHVPDSNDALPGTASGLAVADVKITAEKLPTLSAAEIGNVAKAVLSFTELKTQIANLDKSIESANKIILGFAATGRLFDKAGEGNTKTEVVSNAVKEYFAALRCMKVLVRGVHQPALQATGRACAAALNYAAASAKAYGASADVKALAAA